MVSTETDARILTTDIVSLATPEEALGILQEVDRLGLTEEMFLLTLPILTVLLLATCSPTLTLTPKKQHSQISAIK